MRMEDLPIFYPFNI